MKREFITSAKGKAPAVALVNPKYPHNVAGVLRSCSAFGVRQLWITGERAIEDWEARGRLPREERMRAYGDVEVCLGDYFFNAFSRDVTPVAVEVRENAEPLATFQHPENALYVYGPEDGSLSRVHLQHCHRFIVIPTRGRRCLNLSVAVAMVLGHRMVQRQLTGAEPMLHDFEEPGDHRGFVDNDEIFQWETP